MKTFVKDVTAFFKISFAYTRVSVMSYASYTNIHFYFSTYFRNKAAMDYAIDSIRFTGGGTQTAKALNTAYSDMFARRNGARGTGQLDETQTQDH